jgi:hypothetical protein
VDVTAAQDQPMGIDRKTPVDLPPLWQVGDPVVTGPNRIAVDTNVPRPHRQQPGDRFEQGGFTGAIGPNQRRSYPGWQVQPYTFERQ